MYNTILIKRRVSGAAGAPGTLSGGELAFNEVDSTLYYGSNTGVIAIAGSGAYVNRTSAQSVSGVKTFEDGITLPLAPVNSTDAANKGYVDSEVDSLSGVLQTAIDSLTLGSTTDLNALSAELKGDINTLRGDLTTTIDAVSSSLDARITAEVAAVIDNAPELLNTLNELASALGDDENFAVTIANQITNINTELDAVSAYAAAQFADVNTEIDSVSAYAATQFSNLGTNSTSLINSVSAYAETQFAAVNTELDSVSAYAETQFSAVNTEIDSVSAYAASQFSAVNTELDSVSAYAETRFAAANTYVHANFLPLSGGHLTGALTSSSTISAAGTIYGNSGLEISGGAGSTTFYVENGKVGINTEAPNEELTVVGSISATEDIFARNATFTGTLNVTDSATLASNLSGNGSTSTITGFILDGGSF